LFFILVVVSDGYNQENTIPLFNKSFESPPKAGDSPIGWLDSGVFPMESPVDVQPGNFEVDQLPNHGRSYLGMVARATNTWEMVGQELYRVLEKEKCYTFSIYLARSLKYISPQILGFKDKVNYDQPLILKIWGGAVINKKDELLGQTNPIKHSDWRQYSFTLKPKSTHRYFVLEAYYTTSSKKPYNGNIILDNASDIVECPKKKSPQKKETIVKTPKPEPPKILNLNRKELTKNQVIKIDKLYFLADSSTIQKESYDVLNELYLFLKSNSDISIEIGGHTNTIPPDYFCDRLSTKRAKAVYDYLVKKGLPAKRLKYKGYGKRNPLTKDTTPEGKKLNQRVEIKILEIKSTN
jgi:outer membrane protein OmpA-like peptidoglycan-associated protein